MREQEEARMEMGKVKMSMEFSKQKEKAAVEACKKASQQVEDVKRQASMKIDDAHKRLHDLEVNMHLTGWQSEKSPMHRDIAQEPETVLVHVQQPDVVSEMKMSEDSKLLRS